MVQQVRPGGPQSGGQPAVTQPYPSVIIDDTVEPPIVIFPGVPDEAHAGGLVAEFLAKAVERLPEDFYQIERATWYSRAISPLRSRDLELGDTRYELNTGAVDGYLMDKDGLRYLRKWRVPASSFTPYEFDDFSDDGFGILRDLSGIVDGLIPSGTDYGDIVSVDGVEVFKDFGILGPIFSDTRAVRIEYRRRGELVCRDDEGFGPNYVVPPSNSTVPPTILIPPTACGALDMRWAHNSRVGVFTNETLGELFYVGADPDDPARLIAFKTVDFGETWTRADDTFTSHSDDLASFDCHQLQPDHALYIAQRKYVFISMQENSTGRVSYAKFNVETSLWVFTDREVVASADTDHNFAGITVTSSGDVGILYETDKETVSTPRLRNGYRYSSDDGLSWSAQLDVGSWTQSYNDRFGRPVSDNAGRVQIFLGCDNGGFGSYVVQTIRADHSLSAVTTWQSGSALSQIQSEGCMGDYCTFELEGVTQIAYICRMTFTMRYTLFASSDNMIAPYQPPDVRDGIIGTTFNGLGGVGYEASYPQVSARFDGASLHMMANSFSNSVPTYFYHKQAASPFAPGDFLPTGDADQAGPTFTISGEGIPGQEMAAQVVEIHGELYYVSLRDSANAGFGVIFNFIKLDLLPSTQTIASWAAECI